MAVRKVLIIDGYNVIHRIPELRSGLERGLEAARGRLARRVSEWRSAHPGFECIIVFDGRDRTPGGHEQREAGIRCVFSRESSEADREIIRIVRDSGGGTSEVIVVSDDNSVGNSCRAHGASVRPSSFVMAGKSRGGANRGKTPGQGKTIDRKAAAEIDRELKKRFGL